MYFISALVLLFLLFVILGVVYLQKSVCIDWDDIFWIIFLILLSASFVQVIKDFSIPNPYKMAWKVECIKAGKKISVKEFKKENCAPEYFEVCE